MCALLEAAPITFVSQGMDFAVVNPAGGQPFGIGTYEVTVSDYVAFLNSVAATDTYNLYTGKSTLIARAGSSGSYRYASQAFKERLPVDNVNWYQAARFANWLTNYRTPGSTENGAYALNGLDQAVAAREPGALYFIPTREEWAEAAYGTGDGLPENYWLYATQSNTLPRATIVDVFGEGDANGTGNSANYNEDSSSDSVANVGTSGGPSFYGAFDMSGNVSEIIDLPTPPPLGAPSWAYSWPYRGGDWANNGISMSSNVPIYSTTFGSATNLTVGFRIATAVVPEPSPLAMRLAASGCVGLRLLRLARQRRAGNGETAN